MSSFLRRTFSRRLPDRLLEISECIYVFDSCLTTTTVNEKDFKSYLAGVVASLQRFHAGASFMVFNFREGDQISLLSDILIDYDMTVVDYPRNHEGYPLLPLEMIHYILRSSESWLSLPGQKNVILMHCEKGGWPVLAFMLAGLLLYRKQHTGEQKTLEMIYKMAPKQVFSVLSPINARPSQLRYLRYITGRDLALDWPPPDAPLVVDYLMLHNLPLFDGGKGCRPVVRVYGQDPSEKADRDPRLLLSTLMADEPAWQYPKEECMNVKLQLRCKVQGDVFLECIHLYDDLATEELIFKVMFHTGFIQSNVLALNSTDIDVPWTVNYQLPKDFMAEVLFRDINESPPPHISMELASVGDCRDSDNEFFEVEEIFTPMSVSPETKVGFKLTMDQEATVQGTKNRDCTLHNGSPRWDLESEKITDLASSKDTAFDDGIIEHASEIIPHIKDIVVNETNSLKERDIDEAQLQQQVSEKEVAKEINIPGSGAGPLIFASRNISNDLVNYQQASEKESDIIAPTSGSESGIAVSKNIVFVDDMYHTEVSEKELGIKSLENIIVADILYNKEASETQSEEEEEEADDGYDINTSEAEFVTSAFKNIVVDESNHIQALEKEMYVKAQALGEESSRSPSKEIVLVEDKNQNKASETEIDNSASKNIVENDIKNHNEVPESQYEAEGDKGHNIEFPGEAYVTSVLKNILVDESDHTQYLEAKVDIIEAGGAESIIRVPTDTVPVDDKSHKKASEVELDSSVSKSNVMEDIKNHEKASKAQSDITAPMNILASDIKIHSQALETSPEAEAQADEGHDIQASGPKSITSVLKNIVVDESSHIRSPKIGTEISVAAPTAESDIRTSRDIVLVDNKTEKLASEIVPNVVASKSIEVGDIGNPTEVLETKSKAEADEGQNISSSQEALVTSALNYIVLDDGNHLQTPKTKLDVSALPSGADCSIMASENIVLVDKKSHEQVSEIELDNKASENIVAKDDKNHKAASETHVDMNASERNEVIVNINNKQSTDQTPEVNAPKNVIVVDDKSQIQHVKVEIQPKLNPSPSKPKANKRNKWQELTAKTITQQRVVSQWVPRSKPPAPEPAKPKVTAYKWVPKGASSTAGEN